MASTGRLVIPPTQGRRQYRAFGPRVLQGRSFIALCVDEETALQVSILLNASRGWESPTVVAKHPRAAQRLLVS